MQNPQAFGHNPKAAPESLSYLLSSLRLDWLRDLRSANRSPSTVEWYGRRLEYFERQSGIRTLDQLTKRVLRDYLLAIREGQNPDSRKAGSDAYAAGCWRAIKAFVFWCRREGYPVHPSLFEATSGAYALKAPSQGDAEIQIFTQEEVAQLRQASAKHPRDRLIVELFLRTGVRIHEGAKIVLEDFQGAQLRVLGKGRGQGKKLRWVPLSRDLQRMVEVYVRKYRPSSSSDQLFLQDNGKPLSKLGLDSMFDRLGELTGIHCNAHKFRHTMATWYLVKNPGAIGRLRDILGHFDIVVTQRYLHLAQRLSEVGADYDAEDPFA